MKLLAALLLAVSINANADVMTMPNKSNGEIVLTTQTCQWSKDTELYFAYTYSETEVVEGCWLKVPDAVVIGWVLDGQVIYKEYNDAGFVLKKTI